MDDMDNNLPPPAYTEQEFDRKVSNAMQVSLRTPQPAPRDEDGWEVWNESAFQAALSAASERSHHETTHSWSTQPAGSSTAVPLPTSQVAPLPVKPPRSPTAVQPLRVHKKSASLAAANTPSKQRPSWLNEAEHTSGPRPPQPRLGPSSAAASSSHQPVDFASPGGSSHYAPPIHRIPSDEDEIHTLPPPPFSAEGPSLDGPDYHEVVTMTYHPPNTSRPPSPSSSPLPSQATFYPQDLPTQHQEYSHPYSQPGNHYQAQHHQQPPLQPPDLPYQPSVHSQPHNQLTNHYQPQYHQQPPPHHPPVQQGNHHTTWNRGPRPLPTIKSGKVAPPETVIPRMEFNPSIAYSKRGHNGLPETPPPQQYLQGISANAFYNSAVSPHLRLVASSRPSQNNEGYSAQYLASQPQHQQFKQHSTPDLSKMCNQQTSPAIHQSSPPHHYSPTNTTFQPNFSGTNMHPNSGYQPWIRPEDQYSVNLR